ncbi:MAG: YdcF family protein [Thiomonas sp.]|uniref:YdcF family protein n=1 Tax=Thiomonas sp. TaxID=2047785 RepID=UPI002A36A251|nr:YdcF family protein [Thiomonas sp.]MDY0331637.1 YdcF family protein [Thiomonas sp.]
MKLTLELLLSPVGLTASGLVFLSLFVTWRSHRLATRLLTYAVTVLFVAASMPLFANLALGALEQKATQQKTCPQPPPGTLFVVLAGGLDGNPTHAQDFSALKTASLKRLLAAVQLAQRTPGSTLLISGGWGKTVREANLMGALAVQLGFPASRMILDTKSRTTFQTAVNLREHILQFPQRLRYLVTSADHMPRAMMAFAHEQVSICAWPVDYEAIPIQPLDMLTPQISALDKTTRVVHELLGMLYYRLLKFQ